MFFKDESRKSLKLYINEVFLIWTINAHWNNDSYMGHQYMDMEYGMDYFYF